MKEQKFGDPICVPFTLREKTFEFSSICDSDINRKLKVECTKYGVYFVDVTYERECPWIDPIPPKVLGEVHEWLLENE